MYPAKTLSEVLLAVQEQPLLPGDERYAPLEAGLQTEALQKLRVQLIQALSWSHRQFVHAVVMGHKGCGKSSELYRIEHEFKDQFVCIHLSLDRSLRSDCGYPELFLWLAHSLLEHFNQPGMPDLNAETVGKVIRWFGETTSETNETIKKELSLETEAGGGVDKNWFGLRLTLLAKLKSMIRGSHESKVQFRTKLQNYSDTLLDNINKLLRHVVDAVNQQAAYKGIEAKKRLLIVFDDLDKLAPDVAEKLFFEHGDILNALQADVIFTVPVLVSRSIEREFSITCSMPMVKLKTAEGKSVKAGFDVLHNVIAQRVDIDAIFESKSLVRKLCEYSGGSLRDLMRLIGGATLSSLAAKRPKIDKKSVDSAVKEIRVAHEKLMRPFDHVCQVLARVHQTKQLWYPPDNPNDANAADLNRQLLFNGAVLEYNGDRNWYDVHPVIQLVDGFQKAVQANSATGK